MTTRPATVHFYFYPHATFSEQVVLKDSAGTPIDLTGYTALMHIRREIGATGDPLYELSSAGGDIVLGGVLGTVAIKIPNTETDDVPLLDPDGDMWWYDLLLTNTNATPDTVDRTMQGCIFAMPGVTIPP
jgi:hypothetical protein